jgi:hypothetical protein
MFRLMALLSPPIRGLLTVQVLYDPYVQAPGSPASSNQKAADSTSALWSLCSGSWLSCLLQSEGCWQYKYSMIPMFRLLALLPPPMRRLLTGPVLYDPYVQAPGAHASSYHKAAGRTSTLWSLCSGSWRSCLLQSEGCWQDMYSMIPMFRIPGSPASSNQKAADTTSTVLYDPSV